MWRGLARGRPSQLEAQTISSSSPPQSPGAARNRRLGNIRHPISMFFVWMERQFHRVSNGTDPILEDVLGQGKSLKQVDGVVPPSYGHFGHISCLGPLLAWLGVLG